MIDDYFKGEDVSESDRYYTEDKIYIGKEFSSISVLASVLETKSLGLKNNDCRDIRVCCEAMDDYDGSIEPGLFLVFKRKETGEEAHARRAMESQRKEYAIAKAKKLRRENNILSVD